MNQIKKSGRGGARPGAGRPRKQKVEQQAKRPMGRPALTPEQKLAKTQKMYEVLWDELIRPAFYHGIKGDPTIWEKDYFLPRVRISKTQIKLAYGAIGLECWNTYFKMVKVGGCTKEGIGYATLWQVRNELYFGLRKMLVKDLGFDISNLPDPQFPPLAMIERLKAIDAKAEAKRAKKATPIEAEMKRELELA